MALCKAKTVSAGVYGESVCRLSESGLTLQPFSPGKQSQRWKMMGKRLQNGEDRADWVLGVKEARQYRSTCPAAMSYQATPLHHWTMEYNM